MSIFNFVKKLLPRIERSTVAEDLRTTEKELLNIAIPSWDAAADHFKINKPQSDVFADLSLSFYRNFNLNKAAKSPNFVLDISRRLPNLHANVVHLQSILDKHLEKDIIGGGLTVKGAFILRAASNISLVSRYLLALLNYLYTVEAKHRNTELDPALEIAKAEMQYVDRHFALFTKLLSDYSVSPNDFKELLATRPDVFVNDQTRDAVEGLYGRNKIDPLDQQGIAGFVGNPIYRIRLVIAKWQNDRYESAKAKKQQLELRLLYLQMQKEERQDPTVAKEIERLQARIENYDRYLREVEESVAEDH